MPYALSKPRIQDPSQQLSRAFSLLSLSQVASDGECPKAISMQPAFLVEELNRHQGTMLCCASWPHYRVSLGTVFYEEESRFLYKHHLRLVLFCMLSLIIRFCKVIQFPYGFRYGKSKTQQ